MYFGKKKKKKSRLNMRNPLNSSIDKAQRFYIQQQQQKQL